MKKLLYFFTITMVSVTIAFSATADTIVTDGLVSYWTFDEQNITDDTVKDVWGKNNGKLLGIQKLLLERWVMLWNLTVLTIMLT